MKTKDKIIFTFILLTIVGLLLYKIRTVLTPFILAIVISYTLNPVVNFLCKKFNFSRFKAVSLIMAIFLCFFVVFCVFIFPLLFNQTILLAQSFPSHIENFSDNFYPDIVDFFARFNIEIEHNFFDLIKNNEIFVFNDGMIEKIITNLISSSTFIINILSILFIMPILIFYLLKDWQGIIHKINNNLPKKYFLQIREIFVLIDKSISGFLRGQINICLILAFYYAILLTILGLNNGFIIGFITGVLSFIPYIGYGTGLFIGVIASLFQWGLNYTQIGVILLVYLIGQIIESNFLVPNLIGKKIELHALWIIFGIFFFGSMFGFIGVLLSVPLTAISSVIFKYFIKNYYNK